MDLDTFLTTLYVLVDDWYKAKIGTLAQRRKAGTLKMSDSEVLTVALVGQWQVGVPWRSERGLVRYMQAHGRGWFPKMLQRSAFNERVRQLCMVLAALQRWVAQQVETMEDLYEVGDGVPLPVCSVGQMKREKQHWLGAQSSLGHGGTHGGWFFGQRWWVNVTPKGVITGWLVGAAHLNERWMLEAFLTTRAGNGSLGCPHTNTHEPHTRRLRSPSGFLGGFFAVGKSQARPLVVDRGLNGNAWRQHWWTQYHAEVIAIPPYAAPEHRAWTRADCLWLAHVRQIIETAFAVLDEVFGIKRVNAHSLWGQYTRLAAKAAAYNIALWFNQQLQRPLLAAATLIL